MFEWGAFAVRSYGLVVAVAILLAAGTAYFLAKGTPYRQHIGNLLFYVLIGGVAGARIWHVFFFQWDYYSRHLGEIIAFWNGGIAIQGALIGGIGAAVVYCRKYKLSFWEMADILAPAIILGQAIGRIACFLNADAFGAPTGSGFGIVYPPGTLAFERYGSSPLWPAEVWEGQIDFIIFGILLSLKNIRLPVGTLFLGYNMMYALARFLLEFLRGDSPRYAWGWTAGQWTSMTVLALACLLVLYFCSKELRKKESGLQPPAV